MTHVPFFDLGSFVKKRKTSILGRLESVLDSGVFIGGDPVTQFEDKFSKSIGVNNTIGVGNGLDAIRLLLEAHGIGPGDEVIVPGFTFYATWLAVMQVGATPVPIDVELETAVIDPTKIVGEITERTKAILVVHLFGIPVDMRAVNQIARANDLLVFEDCAQAHFGHTNAGPVGNASDGAAFSFYPTKNLGALGDAGAVCTNDFQVAKTIRSRKSYGVGNTKYEHVDTGWNTRLDSIQATILELFLDELEETTKVRQEIASAYSEALGGDHRKFVSASKGAESVFHHFVLKCKDRDSTKQELERSGIQTDVHYPYFFNSIVPIKKIYNGLARQLPDLPNSRQLSESVLSLPIGPWMDQLQVDAVCEALRNSEI